MTQEQKEFLMNDLYARLPYGVKAVYMTYGKHGERIMLTDRLTGANGEVFFTSGGEEIYMGDDFEAEGFKPILFPLESVGKGLEIGNKVVFPDLEMHLAEITDKGNMIVYRSVVEMPLIAEIVDVYNRYHIDYRDMIGKGLAISVYDLPENPYKG